MDATAVDGVPGEAAALVPGAAPGPADRPTAQRRRRLVVAGVLAADSVWILTYWSEDLDAARPVADAIAASFVPG
ncbi:MAG TPA: hypothetical protein VFZ79_04140 [Acidimicrobiales bacterium]